MMKLHKIDRNPIPNIKNEILLFMVVRNETLRLPYMFEYYFSRGVDRIFVIDNGSTDDTISFLLSQKNTHVFQAKERYAYQVVWINTLLRAYGVGQWCLIVDADEMLIYPYWEKCTLQELTSFLDKKHYNAAQFLLLDMYSDRSICLTSYLQGTDPILTAPYFDPGSYYNHKRRWLFWKTNARLNIDGNAARGIFGGVRKRTFGLNANLSKFSLIKFNPRMHLSRGAHFIKGARIANILGALLHFKFFDDFPERVIEEVRREEHWKKAFEYKRYARKIRQNPEISLYHSGSVKFIDSHQLVKLGIMKNSEKLDIFLKNNA